MIHTPLCLYYISFCGNPAKSDFNVIKCREEHMVKKKKNQLFNIWGVIVIQSFESLIRRYIYIYKKKCVCMSTSI